MISILVLCILTVLIFSVWGWGVYKLIDHEFPTDEENDDV